MPKKRIMCQNCEKYPATTKDYRWYEDEGAGKLLSCKYCASLNDVWHSRVRERHLDPKKVLEK